jgi:uncharacterized protein YeaO (DUF488 family)
LIAVAEVRQDAEAKSLPTRNADSFRLVILAKVLSVTACIVLLGSPRLPTEGLRIGTVRHPPRGVAKAEYGRRNIYDVWFPNLAPSEALLRENRPNEDHSRKIFRRRFLAEMKAHEARRTLDLLAALSHQTNFSVGCYFEDEARCHRSRLRELLEQRGADPEVSPQTDTCKSIEYERIVMARNQQFRVADGG